MITYLYPASPMTVDEEKLAPSVSFKNQVSKVITTILLFFTIYILLISAAIALAIACFYGGIMMITAIPKLMVIIAGLGLMAVGVSVIFFLVKFVFAVSKNENAGRVEITEEEQPRLFAFIRQLTEETKTPFPKKIFLSPDVNACVFYNSSFWSMFVPVKKNLEIGLGLVNAINISEFKAVMAHEFGHFSQRSMKLGSFTYNVNRIIYNMLYENNSYTGFLRTWGNLHGLLAVFAAITLKIAEGIQWILRGMYSLVNKSYMGLSREMEFHADAVAASVAGGNNVVSGLSRIELAQSCYNSAINKADEWLKQNKVAKNIFSNQLSVFHSLASDYNLPIKQGLPEVSLPFLQSFSRSRVNYKDQWASHPALEERKAHLDLLDMNTIPDETRAWHIFDNPESVQEKITGQLYSAITLKDTPEVFNADYFDQQQQIEKERYTLPALYKGYYDNRYPDITGWDLEALTSNPSSKHFEEIFSDENTALYKSIKSNQNDLAIVKAIKDKQIDITSFDFDGEKYTRNDAGEVMTVLEKDIDQQTGILNAIDKEAFNYFYQQENGTALKSSYLQFGRLSEKQKAYIDTANQAVETVSSLHQDLSLEQAGDIIAHLRNTDEQALKNAFRQAIEDGIIDPVHNEPLLSAVNEFLSKQYAYLIGNSFQPEELRELDELIHKVADAWAEYKFAAYKKLLEQQSGLHQVNSR